MGISFRVGPDDSTWSTTHCRLNSAQVLHHERQVHSWRFQDRDHGSPRHVAQPGWRKFARSTCSRLPATGFGFTCAFFSTDAGLAITTTCYATRDPIWHVLRAEVLHTVHLGSNAEHRRVHDGYLRSQAAQLAFQAVRVCATGSAVDNWCSELSGLFVAVDLGRTCVPCKLNLREEACELKQAVFPRPPAN